MFTCLIDIRDTQVTKNAMYNFSEANTKFKIRPANIVMHKRQTGEIKKNKHIYTQK